MGLGVFATTAIPKGTIVWVLDELDQRLPPERVRQLGPRTRALLERYAYLNAAGERVLCWDLARWVNHSCEANALSTGWEFDVAVRDIAAGEQITNDYGCLNLERSFRCLCGSPHCRRRITPGDFERLADTWDEQVRAAFPRLSEVPQPLWSWVQHKRAVMGAVRNPARLPSIRTHQLPDAVPQRSAAAARG